MKKKIGKVVQIVYYLMIALLYICNCLFLPFVYYVLAVVFLKPDGFCLRFFYCSSAGKKTNKHILTH